MHDLIHQDGEQLCALKCGPREGKPSSPNLEAFLPKQFTVPAVLCGDVKADEMALDRPPDRPWDCLSLPQRSVGESFSPECLNSDLLGRSPWDKGVNRAPDVYSGVEGVNVMKCF